MTYPPNFVPRSKPVSYTWLSWLLKLVVPMMVLPPLIWAGTAYLDLKKAPEEANLYFRLIDEQLIEIGKAKNPYTFEGEGFEQLPDDLNPSAQADIRYANNPFGENIADVKQSANEFEQWRYISLRDGVPVLGSKTRGFLIDVAEFGFFDPEFDLQDYSSSEYNALLTETECTPEPVKSQYNMIIYLVGYPLRLRLG